MTVDVFPAVRVQDNPQQTMKDNEMDIYNRTRDVFHHFKLPYDAEPPEE